MTNRFKQPIFPLGHIHNTGHVRQLAAYIVQDLGVNFHPDEEFANYINIETKEPSFTAEECATADALIEECFAVCEREGVDIYDLVGSVYVGRACL